jgi:DNA-binding GntR family transcriptional regulator
MRTGVPDSLTFAVVAAKLATVVGAVACFCAGAVPCCAYVVATRNATESPEMIKAEPRLRSIQVITFIDSPKRHVFKPDLRREVFHSALRFCKRERKTEDGVKYRAMSPTFQKIEPVSKKARIVTMLRDAIISGAIQGGEQIVEGKVAQQFGVGQGLIREALIELEHQGFVQRTPFSGTQVPKLTLENALQIFDIRIELEPLAVFLAGERLDDGYLSELQELSEKTSVAAKAEDLDTFFENHLSFRKKIWKQSGNPYLQQALERLVIPLYALYLIRWNYNREGILQTTLDCIQHQDKILAAYRQKDPEQARCIARDFLVQMKEYLGTRLVPTH